MWSLVMAAAGRVSAASRPDGVARAPGELTTALWRRGRCDRFGPFPRLREVHLFAAQVYQQLLMMENEIKMISDRPREVALSGDGGDWRRN